MGALSVPVDDGRVLEVAAAGPPDGMALFSHHGTPGAAEMFAPLVQIGAARGLRHITYSRPGYGASDRRPGRTVARCIADVEAVADALGYERLYSVGGSGGGPHSVACATLLPERVIAAASIASPAPVDAAGLDWTAGMGMENVTELSKAHGDDDGCKTYLEVQAGAMLAGSAEGIVAVLGDVVAEVDKRALSGELVADHAPLSVWHGGQDRFVPAARGEWLARLLAANAHLRPDDGHLSLTLSSYGEVLDVLLEA
jgi:pimeloyl-ACP methyl ester carboxylesterase